MRKPTSADVAALAGVSQSAVSRAFTPGASIAPRTRARILKAAAALDYRPNALARSLIVGRTHMIGLVVAHLDNQFYPLALEKLSQALRVRGYQILMFLAPNDADSVDTVLNDLIDYQVDAILMGSVTISNRLASRCESAGIPVVLFNRHQNDPALSSVTSDNYAGAGAVADHLVACGHTRVAHIAGSQNASTGCDRARGFIEGLARHGLEPEVLVDSDFRPDLAVRQTRQIFGTADRPDAVFVCNDHLACVVMDTLRFELGLRVPADVAVVGYDDVLMAAWPSYNLTTVRQDTDRMIEATVATLLARIEGGDRTPRSIVLESPLVVRGTTRPLPLPEALAADAAALEAGAAN